MKYNNIVKGIFLERPNRFIAIVEIDNETHTPAYFQPDSINIYVHRYIKRPGL